MTLQVEEILNRLQLPHDSINTTIYPNEPAVILRVELFPNITYTINSVSLVHSAIIEASSIGGCHIINDSVYSVIYISNS